MASSTAAGTAPLRSDAEVMSLVSVAHATSHFFHLLVPTLFPWLMAAFGLSFTRAGGLMTGFFVTSGIGQALAGWVVDRFGARRTLFAGIALFAVAGVVLASAHGYAMLLAGAILAGLGNSVFHPADFTLLNRRVSPARLGHAFSAHGLSGNLGWAAAPMSVAAVATAAGWRAAALASSALAVVVLGLLSLRREAFDLPLDAAGSERGGAAGSPFAFLGSLAVWMCFLFFLVSTMAFGAMQNFAPAVFQNAFGLSHPAATSALTCYLLGSAGGIAFGGFLASRSTPHERTVGSALLLAALLAVGLSLGAIPSWTVAPAMAVIGFCTGCAGPSRDLLVRRAAVSRFGQRSFGRVYGFVYSGLDVGLATAPLLFGRLLDRGMFRAVLVGVAILQVLAVVAALRVGHEATGRA
jgi:FSR family fosmidomycin resistance protein-like MFS transporter